jgi:hypothetical protein
MTAEPNSIPDTKIDLNFESNGNIAQGEVEDLNFLELSQK